MNWGPQNVDKSTKKLISESFIMQWQFLLHLMLAVLLIQTAIVKAQGFLDPFGLRNRNRKDSSMTEDSTEEEGTQQRRRLPFSFLNPFEWSSSSRENERNRGRSRDRNREHESGRMRVEVNYEESTSPRPPSRPRSNVDNKQNVGNNYPEPRMGPGSRSNPVEAGSKKSEGEQYYGPCGPSNIYCQENYIKELGLEWSLRVHNGTGIFIRDPSVPGGRGFLPVGIEQPDEKYGYCVTPEDERGYCRHLEHCVLDEFRTNFITFLKYQCDIPNQNYVGVCCPDEEQEENRKDTRSGVGTSTQSPRNYFPPFLDDRGFPVPPFLRPAISTTTTTTQAPRRRNRTTKRSNPRALSPRSRNCGVSATPRPIPRIVGGRKAKPDDWPWMVALLKKSDAVDYRAGQYCGGVLISEFHIVTAAHCVDGFLKENLAARVGEYDFSQKSDTTDDIDLADYFVHEEYNRYTYQNDIAVLKLAKSAFFHERIKSICLPTQDDDGKALVNQVGHVAGFGTIYYGGPASDVLMEINVPIWDQEECQAHYTQPIEDTNLCAGVRAGSRDSCQGDSGGPLQVQLRGRWTVVGVVSWGIKCSEPGYPGIYTRVSKYLNWIASRMQR